MAVALDIEIRLLRPTDAKQVADLLAVAFAEEFEGAGAETASIVRHLRTGGWSQRGFLRRLAPLLGVSFSFFVAASRGGIVGSTGIMGSRLPLINSVAVRPEFRRRGIAERLMDAAERHAADQGHDAVALDVLAHNTPALRLYEKLGYREYHRYRAYALAGAPTAAPALPPGYRLERPTGHTAAAFVTVERASLPDAFCAVAPTLRSRYLPDIPAPLAWLAGMPPAYRCVLTYGGDVGGYLSAHLSPGVREGRIEYPLFPPGHVAALPAAITAAVERIRRAGATSMRLDLSETRPDHHAVAEALGFRHRWTFVQMVKRLRRAVPIPVRYAGPTEGSAESFTPTK